MVFSFFINVVAELLYSLGLIVLIGILNLLENFGTAMMEPYDFSVSMFSQMFSGNFLNSVENIMITAGISISILLLIFGLLKVFTGRLSDDVPNPFALVGKFLIAVFSCYWIIPAINTYLFPFAQKFFDKIFDVSAINFGEETKAWGQDLIDMFASGSFGSGMITSTIAGFTGIETVKALILLIAFLIFIIAATINILKLVIENAERYFTINVLVLSGPIATSTIVSEKSFQIFRNWFLSLLSNILTITFNLIGFKFVMLAFQNCFKKLVEINTAGKVLTTSDFEAVLIALISLVAISKMAQKFDQFISMIVFRINPIQNRSMLMAALGTVSTFDRLGSSLMGTNSPLGKLAHAFSPKNSASLGNGVGNVVNGSGNVAGGNKPAAPLPVTYDDKLNPSGALKEAVNGDASDKLKENLGLDPDNPAALHSTSAVDDAGFTHIGAGDMIGAMQDANIKNGRDKDITPAQAQETINAINSKLSDGNRIVGFDSNKQEFIVGKTKGNYNVVGDDAPVVANLMNGSPNVETLHVRGSDSPDFAKFQGYKDNGYYYCNRGHGTIDVYLDKTELGESEFNHNM